MASPLAGLHEKAQEAPLQWTPLLAMLVRNHSHHLPHSAYTSWLQAASLDSFEDGTEPALLLWKLRFLQELALAWPAAVTAVDPDQGGGCMAAAHAEAAWKVLH